MRVLLTTHQFFPDFASGTETLTLSVARDLIARGAEVRVLAGFPATRAASVAGMTDSYRYDGIQVYRFHHAFLAVPEICSRIESDFDNPQAAEYFRQILSEFRPDIVHAFHLHRLGTRLILVAEEARVPICFTPTDYWLICPLGQLSGIDGKSCKGPSCRGGNCITHLAANRIGLKWGFLATTIPTLCGDLLGAVACAGRLPAGSAGQDIAAISRRLSILVARLNRVRRIMAPTRTMQRQLSAHGIAPDRIVHLPFGIDLAANAIRRIRTLPNRPVRMGFIGTLAPHKGCHLLLDAFVGMPSLNASLLIYGRDTDFPDYSERLRQLAGSDGRIKFCGEFPNTMVGAVIDDLDVLVVPSLWEENSPLVVYSAQAAGCPVVASDVSGIAEVVRDGVDGLLFAPGDVGALRHCLEEITGSDSLLQYVSTNAPQPASIQDYVDGLIQIWSQGAGSLISAGKTFC